MEVDALMAKRPKSRRTDCGKVRYRDQQEAKMALSSIRSAANRKAVYPVRAYECPECKGWHLTHLPS